MAEEIIVLTERDRDLIEQAVRIVLKFGGLPSQRSMQNPTDSAAPEVYVARTPPSGIPGLTEYTGTSPDEPGMAVCKLFTIQTHDGDYRWAVRPISGLTKQVFNLSHKDVPGNAYVVIKRTKGGTWVVDGDAESSIVETGTGTDFLDVTGGGPCDLARLSALQPDDSIVATGPDGQVTTLRWVSQGRWSSAPDEVSYWTATGPSSGVLIADWNEATGFLDLFLDGIILMNCGNGCYTGGPLTGHVSGTATESGPCQGQTFTICLQCACVPIGGWHGAGWYCVRTGTGTGTDAAQCEPIYLTEARRCDYDIEICTGPYDTYAQAAAVCGSEASSISTSCCPSNSIPSVLDVSFETISGPVCDATAMAIHNGAGRWVSDLPTPGGNLHAELYCQEVSPGTFLWRVDLSGCQVGTLSLAGTCLPFNVASAGGLTTCCTGSTTRIRFQE